MKSTRKVSVAHIWPCAQHKSTSGRGKAGFFTVGSFTACSYSLANSPKLSPALSALSLCSTGVKGMDNSLRMRDFQSCLDVPNPQRPLIQQRMVLTSTFRVWAPCPDSWLSVTAMSSPLPSFSLGSKDRISAVLQLDRFDLSLSCGCSEKSEGAFQRWAASSHHRDSQSSCFPALFHLLPPQGLLSNCVCTHSQGQFYVFPPTHTC